MIGVHLPVWTHQSVSPSSSDGEGGIDKEILAASGDRELLNLDVRGGLKEGVGYLRLALGVREVGLQCLLLETALKLRLQSSTERMSQNVKVRL